MSKLKKIPELTSQERALIQRLKKEFGLEPNGFDDIPDWKERFELFREKYRQERRKLASNSLPKQEGIEKKP